MRANTTDLQDGWGDGAGSATWHRFWHSRYLCDRITDYKITTSIHYSTSGTMTDAFTVSHTPLTKGRTHSLSKLPKPETNWTITVTLHTQYLLSASRWHWLPLPVPPDKTPQKPQYPPSGSPLALINARILIVMLANLYCQPESECYSGTDHTMCYCYC